tara:strand:+ start:603 stop:1220 length:618 start_codon:yes stop_codon:yes gene_type:complete
MLFTDKIFEGKVDEQVHKQFIRFSIGNFQNRALIKITKSKDFFKLNSSYDLMKDLTKIIGKNTEKLTISGKVFYKGKKKEDIEEKEVSGEYLVKICNEVEFVLLNLSFGDYSFKVGKTLPKPGKALKNNFCKAKLPLKLLDMITNEEFKKKLEISHTFVIDNIEVPKEYENDPPLARLNAIRKGKIVRKIIIDGEEKIKETLLEV